ncbi:MAG: hypothetical protein UY96_C0003G0024 [Parcubacteria group bacterium GW2011_GWB1_56_8]|nr:MAG: hypothetical protein UY96_C0003G0024 [Parcubacteria group bacterium GW2011_GWB1_56_8]
MTAKRAIVTVGVSGTRPFGVYLDRFKRTFAEFGGADYLKIWHRDWPPGSASHRDIHYGFKVHAIYEAWQKGFTSILWMDSSCSAFASLDPLWLRLERDGHVLVEDANALGNWCSDFSLQTFGITRDDAMKIRLMCGTCWGVDLTNERSKTFLERLRNFATAEHFNGTHRSRLDGLPAGGHPRPGTEGASVSNDERVWGHRSDEVYMSLLARELGMITHSGVEFIGGSGNTNPRACVRSGYDLPHERPASGPSPARHTNGALNYDGIFNLD